MNRVHAISVVGHACLVDGAWVGGGGSDADEKLELGFVSHRIARADRLTQLAAACTARAAKELAPTATHRLATVGATVLASLRVNVSYEERRHRTGRAAPRDFPRTAPNAWLGEVAIALDAHGPSLCLVGDGSVAAMAIATAARWLGAHACDRVFVIAAESAPDNERWLPAHWQGCSDGAASLVLERMGSEAKATIEATPTFTQPDSRLTSSLDVMSSIVQRLQAGGDVRIEVPSCAGAGWSLLVRA